MATFRKWLDELTTEKPEAFRFGDPHFCAHPERWTGLPVYRTIAPEEADKWLDIEFDDGFGTQDCPNVTIWTATHVYTVHEYDGSTRLVWVERNPPTK